MDEDIRAIVEARDLAEKVKRAQIEFSTYTQRDVDKIVHSMALAGERYAEELAQIALLETGIGVLEHKIEKNLFATKNVYEYIKDIKTCGILNIDAEKMLLELAEPIGVILAIVPVTNPTSTTLYKALIAVKGRNGVIFSPHPRAVKCCLQTVKILSDSAVSAGAPDGLLSCLSVPRIEGTQELMKSDYIDLILATGGTAMVRSAYSSGKPAIGVGPGNVPAFIERTADIKRAVDSIILSKTFDNGIICASEQAIVVDKPIESEVVEALKRKKAYFLTDIEIEKVSKTLIQTDGSMNPKLVGKYAWFIAESSGFEVSKDTTLLIARLKGVGRDYPLSCEKLAPVVAFYVEDGWVKGCERCIEIVNYGGLGHTLVIHSKDQDIVREFGLKKPVFRIIVNGPGSQGAIGLGTGLPPAMTLGCGTWGGSATSDNITPEHLIQKKRLVFNPEEGWFPFKRDFEVEKELVKNINSDITPDVESDRKLGERVYLRSEIEEIVRRIMVERGLL
ncbi:MAG: acetaldehyde dehydrogenase (acetylating) [bacterium]